jgi:hypothetical protein
MQQVLPSAVDGALQVAVCQGIDQLAVFRLVGLALFRRQAAALERAPVILVARLVDQLEDMGDQGIVGGQRDGFVKPSVQTSNSSMLWAASAMSQQCAIFCEVALGSVANHHLDNAALASQGARVVDEWPETAVD